MKYMILAYGTQQDYDGMAGKEGAPVWTAEDLAAMGAYMTKVNQSLEESGELVETRALAAPVHTRHLGTKDGKPVVTDGPYAETQEVLISYWVVDCESIDRATEIAGELGNCPFPDHTTGTGHAEVRPIIESQDELV